MKQLLKFEDRYVNNHIEQKYLCDANMFLILYELTHIDYQF